MKKVLVVAGKLYIGGAERVCRNIGFFADPDSFQVDYLVFGDRLGAYEPELIEKGCRVWHCPSPSKGYLKFFLDLKRQIRENQYDVVHGHTMFNSGIVLRAARQCGVPIRIAHSHSIRAPGRRAIAQSLYERLMRRWLLRDATHLVGCGQAAGAWLFGEKAFARRGIVLLNGIELERFAFDAEKRRTLREKHHWENALLLGQIGHLTSVKNQIFLLRLMPRLLQQVPNARLVLLGEGADRAMLERAVADWKLEDFVYMPGNVENVNEYLSAMDVLVFPSLYEGMPLAVLEAQANGLPCVLSDRVPQDVFLTELVCALPLDAEPEEWLRRIQAQRRSQPERYAELLAQRGLDTGSFLKRVYALYEGA